MNECRERLESTVNSGKRRNRSDIIVKKFLRLLSQMENKDSVCYRSTEK